MTSAAEAAPVYCAPLTVPLTVLHIAEPGVDLATEPEPGDADRLTRCGMIMAADDHWIAVRLRLGDRVCLGCALDGLGDAPEQLQLALDGLGDPRSGGASHA